MFEHVGSWRRRELGRRIRWLGTLASISLPLVVTPQTLGQGAGALPDRDAFLQNVRSHLSTDRQILSQYAYREQRTELRRNRDGEITKRLVRLFEAYPSPVPRQTYRRLVSVNGVVAGREELEKQDQEHERRVGEWSRKTDRDGTADRVPIEAEDARRERETIDEIFRPYDIQLTNREIDNGHSTIVLSFTPRQGSRPQTSAGKVLKHFKGRAWASEQDYQLVRIEAEATDDVTIGFGLIAGVYAESRAFLFRRFNMEVIEELSDYQKVDVKGSGVFRFSRPPR